MSPTLTTARLVLTPHRPSDLDAVAALNGDPAVMTPIGAPVATREQSWHRLLRYIGHWQALGYGHWLVRDRGGTHLGDVGLMDSRRRTDPDFQGVVEAGWAFHATAQGYGYAQEAGAAMLAWADRHGIARTVCMIDPGNARSLRLAERLGYRGYAEGRYDDRPVLLLERAAR